MTKQEAQSPRTPRSSTIGDTRTPAAPKRLNQTVSIFSPRPDTSIEESLVGMRARIEIKSDEERKERNISQIRLRIEKDLQAIETSKERIAKNQLELIQLGASVDTSAYDNADTTRNSALFVEIVTELMFYKILPQRNEGETDNSYYERVRITETIVQKFRSNTEHRQRLAELVQPIINAFRDSSSTALLHSPRRLQSSDNHEDLLSIDQIDLEIVDDPNPSLAGSQVLLTSSYQLPKADSSFRDENKKVLDIKSFLDLLISALENLSDEKNEITTESLKSALESLKKGIVEIKNTSLRNKSRYTAMNARLQSTTSENVLLDNSYRIEGLSEVVEEIEKLLSQISSETKDKKTKDGLSKESIKESIEALLLEIRSTTSEFQNLQQELNKQIRQEGQDKEKLNQTTLSEDDRLKKRIIKIIESLDQTSGSFPVRNLDQEFLDSSSSATPRLSVEGLVVPRTIFSARKVNLISEQGFAESNAEDDSEAEDLTQRLLSEQKSQSIFSYGKTGPDSLINSSLEDLVTILESTLTNKLEEFKLNLKLQARLEEDTESELITELRQQIENKKSRILHLEETIAEEKRKTLLTAEAQEVKAGAEAIATSVQEVQVDAKVIIKEFEEKFQAAEEAQATSISEIEKKIKEIESLNQQLEQQFTIRQRGQLQPLDTNISQLIQAFTVSNHQSLEALREISANSASFITKTSEAVQGNIMPLLHQQTTLVQDFLAKNQSSLKQMFDKLSADGRALSEERKESMQQIQALFLEIQKQREDFFQQIQQQQQTLFAEITKNNQENSQRTEKVFLQAMETIRAIVERTSVPVVESLASTASASAPPPASASASAPPAPPPASASASASPPKLSGLRRPPKLEPSKLPNVPQPKPEPKTSSEPYSTKVETLKSPETPRPTVVPKSLDLLDKNEIVRDFLSEVAKGQKEVAKGYYDDTKNGSSIKVIIESFFSKQGIKLENTEKAYSLISNALEKDQALKKVFAKRHAIISDSSPQIERLVGLINPRGIGGRGAGSGR